MHTGSCLCGAVQYEIHGDVGPSYYCHCSICRKVTGSALSANAVVDPSHFFITRGKDKIKAFTNESGVSREFCSDCGSPIRVLQGEHMRLRLGSLDTGSPALPSMHIYVASKAGWDLIMDNLPRYDKRTNAVGHTGHSDL
jgi:hypothetical protein